MITNEEIKKATDRLDRLTPSLTRCYKDKWLRHRHAHLTDSLYIEHRVDIDLCEVDGKTDEELKKLISKRMCSVLRYTLKELGDI